MVNICNFLEYKGLLFAYVCTLLRTESVLFSLVSGALSQWTNYKSLCVLTQLIWHGPPTKIT